MMTSISADRASQASAQQYAFPTVKLSYVRDFQGVPPKQVKTSYDCFQCLQPVFEDCLHHYEEFHILLLNRANEVLGTFQVGRGGLSATVADPRLILQAAILSNCSALVLAHNHPSGTNRPSQSDRGLTNRLKEVVGLLDIELLDHIIFTGNGYYSFKDNGLM